MNPQLMRHWPQIRRTFYEGLRSNLHIAVATVDRDGNPHVTPIGSLLLQREPSGFFFDIFSKKMLTNLETNQTVCIMAVASRKRMWLSALLRGRFKRPPGVRLYGRMGERRPSTPEEVARGKRLLPKTGWTKGHKLLWNDLSHVRDIHFHDWAPVQLGEMTRGIWRTDS